jgi:hypothetical protein
MCSKKFRYQGGLQGPKNADVCRPRGRRFFWGNAKK